MATDFETQSIAITVGGHIHIMQIIESAPIAAFSVSAATEAGFGLKGEKWLREVTDAVVEAEIARTPSVAANSGWRRIKKSDIPKDRSKRDKLMDDGKKLSHRKD